MGSLPFSFVCAVQSSFFPLVSVSRMFLFTLPFLLRVFFIFFFPLHLYCLRMGEVGKGRMGGGDWKQKRRGGRMKNNRDEGGGWAVMCVVVVVVVDGGWR